jgi:protein-S-isoprenylcysteine O-methyltransferase Ste14
MLHHPILHPFAGAFLSTELIFITPILLPILGVLFSLIEIVLLLLKIRLFILIGRGIIMPWDPTKKLIVVSLYAYVRNPMLLSIIIILLGEVIFFIVWDYQAGDCSIYSR